ncbi:MAG: hypothetical protein M1836_000153 [Candelina mexicana]|nr:MAG: hypothetical protein M1836_000153 [Candelina mexicana]
MSSSSSSAPFTRAVVNSVRKLYPEALADKSFDNTGLLLEAPFDPIRRQMNSVLLTIDLTTAVADEAIDRKDSIVVAYHPIIFRGLKSLTLADTQQQSLLRLAQEGISVYCPHTAVDAVPGGLGDWLADIVTGTLTDPEPPPDDTSTTASSPDEPKTPDDPFITVPTDPETPKAQKPTEPSEPKIPETPNVDGPMHTSPKHFEATKLKRDHTASSSHTRSTINPSVHKLAEFEDAGMGRIITFKKAERLSNIIERIARGMGNPPAFPIAIPQGKQIDEISILSVGICAGSGGSLLNNLDVDLLFTGELSHHEALAAIEQGKVVISLFHSNTERGYLKQVMQDKLYAAVSEEWPRLRKEIKRRDRDELSDAWEEALNDENVNVEVSESDRDPYGIVISRKSAPG